MASQQTVLLNPLEGVARFAEVDLLLRLTEDYILRHHAHTPVIAVAFMNIRHIIAEEAKRTERDIKPAVDYIMPPGLQCPPGGSIA